MPRKRRNLKTGYSYHIITGGLRFSSASNSIGEGMVEDVICLTTNH